MLWQLKYYQISGPVGMCRQAPVLYEKIGDFDCPLGEWGWYASAFAWECSR